MCCIHFIPGLEIWWMILKNNRAPLLCYVKLCASNQIVHQIGEFELTLQSENAQFKSKSAIFWSRVTLQFDVWPWKTIGHLFYVASNFVHHFIAISEFWLELQSGNAQFGSKSMFFVSCDLKIWWMTLKNKRAHHLLSNIKLCASFHHHHMWIATGVSWVLTSATFTFDLWPWPFVWTSLRSLVITPKISRWYDDANTVKRVWQTERRTELTIHRAAWSQLKKTSLSANARMCSLLKYTKWTMSMIGKFS